MALGFFSRLKEGLTRSTQKLTEGITGITAVFSKRRLDDAHQARREQQQSEGATNRHSYLRAEPSRPDAKP